MTDYGACMRYREYANIPEELKYRIVFWFLRHAEKKLSKPYGTRAHPKVADMYHDFMESIDPSYITKDVPPPQNRSMVND